MNHHTADIHTLTNLAALFKVFGDPTPNPNSSYTVTQTGALCTGNRRTS